MIWVDLGLVLFSLVVFVLVLLTLWRKTKATLRTGREFSDRAGGLAARAGALAALLEFDTLPGRPD